MLRVGEEFKVSIDRMAYGGRGVGRHNGLVVFVAGAAPVELVKARATRVRRRFAEAEVVEVLSPSIHRVEPRCPHFGVCGGCAWQHIAYGAQAGAKESIVRESLVHLGGMADASVRPVVRAPTPWFYRNKMEFSFHPEGILGLHRRGDWNRIVAVESCFLQSEESVAVVRSVRELVSRIGALPYDPASHAGDLRSLVVRVGKRTGDRLVGIVTGPRPLGHPQEFVRAVRAAAPAATGVVRGVLAGDHDSAPLSAVQPLEGRPFLEEELAGLRFTIGLDTFFQTNTDQADRMIDYVLGRAGCCGRSFTVDLYCGVGTFALALARAGRRVVGVELSPASIAAARANAARNGIDRADFIAGDARIVLPQIVAEHGRPDLLVLDPPRAGAGGKVMRKIGRSGARRVVYVSCNPTTLAPDLRELLPFGYRLLEVQPFDMFPQTHHVEAVAVLDSLQA